MEPWSELPGTFLVGLCHMMPWTQVKVVRLVCKGWCAALDGALQKCTSLRVSSADFARPDRVARLPTLFSTFPNVRTVLIEQADDEEPGRRAAVLPALQGLVSLLSSSGTAASRVPAIQELAVRMPQYAAMSFFFRDDQTSAGLAGVLAGCLRSAAAGRGALAGLRTLRLDGLVLAYPTHSMDPLSREPYPPDDAPAAQNQGTAEQAELAAAAALAADAARLQRADDLGALLQRPLFHGLPALRSLDLVNTNACGALLMDVAHLTQLTRLVLRPGVAFGYKTRSEAAAVFHGLRTLFWSLSNLRHLELDASINYARPFHPGIATVELELQRALLSSRLPHLTSLHMSPCLPPQRASPEDMDAARQLAQTVLPFPRHHQLQLFPAHALQMTSLTVYNLDAAHCHAVRSMPALQELHLTQPAALHRSARHLGLFPSLARITSDVQLFCDEADGDDDDEQQLELELGMFGQMPTSNAFTLRFLQSLSALQHLSLAFIGEEPTDLPSCFALSTLTGLTSLKLSGALSFFAQPQLPDLQPPQQQQQPQPQPQLMMGTLSTLLRGRWTRLTSLDLSDKAHPQHPRGSLPLGFLPASLKHLTCHAATLRGGLAGPRRVGWPSGCPHLLSLVLLSSMTTGYEGHEPQDVLTHAMPMLRASLTRLEYGLHGHIDLHQPDLSTHLPQLGQLRHLQLGRQSRALMKTDLASTFGHGDTIDTSCPRWVGLLLPPRSSEALAPLLRLTHLEILKLGLQGYPPRTWQQQAAGATAVGSKRSQRGGGAGAKAAAGAGGSEGGCSSVASPCHLQLASSLAHLRALSHVAVTINVSRAECRERDALLQPAATTPPAGGGETSRSAAEAARRGKRRRVLNGTPGSSLTPVGSASHRAPDSSNDAMAAAGSSDGRSDGAETVSKNGAASVAAADGVGSKPPPGGGQQEQQQDDDEEVELEATPDAAAGSPVDGVLGGGGGGGGRSGGGGSMRPAVTAAAAAGGDNGSGDTRPPYYAAFASALRKALPTCRLDVSEQRWLPSCPKDCPDTVHLHL